MAQNRLLTPAELARFRVENAKDIAAAARNGTLTGATDQVTADFNTELRRERQKIAKLRRMTTDEQQNLERPSSQGGSSRAGNTFNGKQGQNRPPSATPQYDLTDDDEYGDVKEFLKGKLSEDEHATACQMLDNGQHDELMDGLKRRISESDHAHVSNMMSPRQGTEELGETPDQAETKPQKSLGEMEGEDDPPAFPGRPRTGGATDYNVFGFDMSVSESNSRRHQAALRLATLRQRQRTALRGAAADRTRRQSEKLAQDEAKQRRASAQTQAFATMARDAPAAIPDVTKMYPDLARIGRA